MSVAAISNFDESRINALVETTIVKGIGQNGWGYDQIDVRAFTENSKSLSRLAQVPSSIEIDTLCFSMVQLAGILVSNTLFVNAGDTAQITSYLMLLCLLQSSMADSAESSF
ncbi:hypothetical protein PAXINDRAFT_21532 [Paxillus involutus ATCC 200175]|uniref:Unplaced genomic scaffold PAXINscaffold_1851, whole genome shotgun sequence n=1 Tax=Paxillus involutus ATCC 200175 TaxID=664439 RepID=A0A0C9ST78_PAXIN|nr:hypothetical protein PAXINDRAFT_21532 [Paxillus involutus ATCC 200175]